MKSFHSSTNPHAAGLDLAGLRETIQRGLQFARARSRQTVTRVASFLLAAASVTAQTLTLSGGGTISLGQSANIVASPAVGVPTAYNLVQNGVVVQTVGTFGVGGAGTAVGNPHTFTVTPNAPGIYVYTAHVALNLQRGGVEIASQNSVTLNVVAPNRAPTISWTSVPGTAGVGQAYVVAAHGHDDDGNLTAVSIWKNGQPFAFAGGGNGTDGDTQNATSDSGPTTATFTAQSSDASGVASGVITQTVTITSANRPPTISWNTNPGTVASSASYTISAHGRDGDGNLTQVNVWKNGQPFAFVGGGNGFDSDSGNPTSDIGPQTVIYTANAVDSSGAASATISLTVTVSGIATNQAPTINWNLAPISVAGGQNYAISAHGHDSDGNLIQVNVWKNGIPFAFAGGGNGFDHDSGNSTFDDGPASITFTAQAVDASGQASATISHTVSVIAATSVTATLSTNPTTGIAPAATTITWSSANATAVSVVGPGLSGSMTSGSQVVPDLPPGNHTYTLTAQGPGGPITRTATFSVTSTGPTVSASITATPASGTAPVTATISWNTVNASSVTVSGPGVSSTATNGVQTVGALPPGSYAYAITAQGSGGPITRRVLVDVTSPVAFALTTSASDGGSVTPGGSYAPGTIVTISAGPDATHRFTGWSGDATGSAASIAITMDRAKFAQANFMAKATQTIAFAAPEDRTTTASPFGLSASASSGLPVTFAVLDGPATLVGGMLQLTGAGAITVVATQAGDDFYLPATPVSQTFNATAIATLKYRPAARTLLESDGSRQLAPIVIERP